MFTVVVPLYNKGDTLEDTINSVLQQTYSDYEIVIIDDGSTDGSGKVADSLSSNNIRVIHQTNAGVSAARNTGIENAQHPYICFLDADDKWLPNHLEELYKLILQYPGMGLYSTTYRLIHKNGEVETFSDPNLPVVVNDYLKYLCYHKSLIHTDTVCIPKEVFNEVGFFTVGERISEDISMWLRVALCFRIAIDQVPTTEYHRENSTASAIMDYNPNWKFPALALELVLKKQISEEKVESLKDYLNRYQSGVFVLQCKLGKKREAIKTIKTIDFKRLQFSRLLKMIAALCCPPFLFKVYRNNR